MKVLFTIILALIGGLVLSRVVKYLKLPNVTGYLIAGLLVGPCCLKFVSSDELKSVGLLTTIALGFIAFSIGGEFKIDHLKKLGAKIFVITLTQASGAVIFVMAALFVLRIFFPEQISVPLVLLLSAIATATAPAATLMVVRQYKAKGPVTDALLPVVAFDDAIGLIIFSVCFAVARVFAVGGKITFSEVVIEPLREIILSLAVGGAIGWILSLCMKFFKSRANRLSLMITSVFLGVFLSDLIELSSLLTCMMIGGVFANLRKDSDVILEGCERWTPPLFMLFFVISGAELDVSVIPHVGVAGIAYLIARSLGKYFGAYFGSSIAKAENNVKKYLGVALLPQAGVAIGMAQMVANMPDFGNIATQVLTVVLSATLVYELVGPLMTKIALTKAGEITEENKSNGFFASIFKKKSEADKKE